MITTEILDGLFARDAHLEGPHLEDVNFVNAHFNGAHLEGVHLNGRNLSGVHLIGAHLERAYLSDAHLFDAHLEGAHLQSAHLERAHLEGAHLEDAVAPYVHLTGAHLQGAHLERANLNRARLGYADLRGAHLEGAHLDDGVDFRHADLRGAHLEGAHLEEAGFRWTRDMRRDGRQTNLRGAHLEGAHLWRADLRGANLRDAHLNGAHLTGAKFRGANLRGADLRGADLTDTDFRRADLTGAILTGVINANYAKFAGAIGVNFNNVAPPVIAHPVFAPGGEPGGAPGGIAPGGIAHQVHNEFKVLNIVKFMEIIRANITRDRIEGELLEKLITYSVTNLPAQTTALRRINDTIKSYSGKNGNDVQDVITFVLLQPPLFIERYTEWFVDECLKAYTTDNNQNTESCVKGQYERVFMSLKGVLGLTCNETPDCPPVYRELLACFKPDYDKLFRDWFETTGQLLDAETNYENKLPKEKEAYINSKKAIFKAYVVRQIGKRHDIDEYLDNQFSGFYAQTFSSGGRKRKTNKRKTKKCKTNKRKTKKRKG
jgi:uncharacterized protein YjbI with pentapeptide repeats